MAVRLLYQPVVRVVLPIAYLTAWLSLNLGCSRPPGKDSQAQPSATASAPRRDDRALRSAKLTAQLERALKQKGSDYVPRTRHKDPGGSPEYTNRLIRESSPYLLQHAHNPVDWFPWGPEALATARRLGRPIFLSVGYSTCHWCHVMEEESFENPEIANYLNQHYVPIKVDREQRPDLDSIYMTAVQLLTRRGGWPMSVWLTPELEPFFGGTYFPPRTGARGSRIGFLELLREQATAFRNDPKGIAARAQQLTQRISAAMRPAAEEWGVTEDILRQAVANAKRGYDPTYGGRRGAPKFPSSFPVRLLMRASHRDADEEAKQQALETLRHILRGGIYDHVGGGFHRYSVDRRWLVPHFEKMLYDNALLTLALLDAFQITSDPEFEGTVRETLDYLLREMRSPQGGFYSATDADSVTPAGEREEGYYFTWTPQELSSLLGPERTKSWGKWYGVSPGGNFEGRSILSLQAPLESLARSSGTPYPQLRLQIARTKTELRAEREKRPAPLRDDKILASWNGLTLSALARAGRILGEARYTRAAEANATFIATRLVHHGRLAHHLLGDKRANTGFLQDYSFVAGGLLDLFETTQNWKYLEQASMLMNALEKHHGDTVRGGYYLTANDHETLLVREKPDSDKAVPSGNSSALMNELKLHQLTGQPRWQQRAETTLRAFSRKLRQRPGSLDTMLLAVDFYFSNPKQVVVVSATPQRAANNELVSALNGTYHPNHVLVHGTEEQIHALASHMPWLSQKTSRGTSTAYVCEAGSCQLPTSSAKELLRQLRPLRKRGP